MENLKSSLKELRSVLVEIQTLTANSSPVSPVVSLSESEKQELLSLRRFKQQTAIALESIIAKIETALKDA